MEIIEFWITLQAMHYLYESYNDKVTTSCGQILRGILT